MNIDLKEQDIIPFLYAKFDNQKYCLSNSYIFNSRWESDFFSVSSAGYCQEIEIKTSYSDFKADFKKIEKHNILDSKFNNSKFVLNKGRMMYNVEYEEGKSKLDENGKRVRDKDSKTTYSRYVQEPSGKFRNFVSGYIDNLLKRNGKDIFNLKCTESHQEIKIINLNDVLVPNKFMYVCPTNIIPLEEVPEYAGLMYINENGRFRYIKKPPFIHKDLQENKLNNVLLHKFYWLSLNLEREVNELKRKL